MASPPVPDEVLQERLEAYAANGMNQVKAAAALGISRGAMQQSLIMAARRGLMGTKPILPGFAIKKTSTQLGPDGALQKEWVQQSPEAGEVFEVPAGHAVKGVSALVGADGRTIQQWIKTREEQNAQDAIAAIKEAFDGYKGFAKLPPEPKKTDDELLTVYNIADHHLGLYAWAREAGADYDLTIGERLLKEAISQLVSLSPSSENAVILNLGDFFHADNSENRTSRSGNALDVDTRYSKVLKLGVDLLIWCVELSLQRHAKVTVRCLPGNHDEHTAVALAIGLACFFDKNPRVTVDLSPSLFFKHVFGKVLLTATHGHQVKPADMAGVMASMYSEDWGKTVYRYGYFGHVHHQSKIEKHGMICETFQTVAAKDSWHAGMGYSSGRSMTAITHHRDHGEILRHTASVKGL